MKKLALTALAAAFALAACDNTPNDDTATTAGDTTATVDAGTDTTTVVPGPTATETTVVTTPGATATTTTNANGDRVTVGPDGVTADVGDSDTRVRVNTDNPSMTVEKK
ncbi:hypothetical protein [Tsuneonella rigui]|jgi:hypothetical protein|uniref:hypothetical protein n=1 Tax=Tsuneonella rigui TaxID=1708790 RepID=UPI000F7E17DF|nr:hypothetical protein [Tsuneonella rigui]